LPLCHFFLSRRNCLTTVANCSSTCDSQCCLVFNNNDLRHQVICIKRSYKWFFMTSSLVKIFDGTLFQKVCSNLEVILCISLRINMIDLEGSVTFHLVGETLFERNNKIQGDTCDSTFQKFPRNLGHLFRFLKIEEGFGTWGRRNHQEILKRFFDLIVFHAPKNYGTSVPQF